MKITEQVNLHHMATSLWYGIPESARQYILQRLTELVALPRAQWPKDEVKRLTIFADARYLLHFPPGVEPEGLRVVFRDEGPEGPLTVMDMYLQEFVDRYFSKQPEPTATA